MAFPQALTFFPGGSPFLPFGASMPLISSQSVSVTFTVLLLSHFVSARIREFFVGAVTDEQARVYETAVAAQQAALAVLRPGVAAEDVHLAAQEVYRSAGFGQAYRTGRAIGYSFLEEPQLKRGDKTIELEAVVGESHR